MNRQITTGLFAVLICTLMAVPSWGHLMAAQKGTLRFEDERAYLVVSLPVSAFNGLDQDGDGGVTQREFESYRAEVVAQVQRGVLLQSSGGIIALTDILLSPETSHSTAAANSHSRSGAAESAVIDQVTVLGVFPLGFSKDELALSIELYGTAADEQAYEMSVSTSQTAVRQVRLLTPQFSRAVLTDL